MVATLKFIVDFLDSRKILLPKNKAELAKILWTYSKEHEELILKGKK